MIQLQGKKKFKTGVLWLAWSGVLAFVSVGGWLVYAQTFKQFTKAVAVRFVTVEQGNVEVAINESGTVELGGQQLIKSPGEVTVDRVLVGVGDRVQLAQQLLVLRNQQIETNFNSQELDIRKQELKLTRDRQKVVEASEKLKAAQQKLREPISQELDIRKQEFKLARSRQKVEEAQEKLKATRKQLQQKETLAKRGIISGNDLQTQQEKVRDAESALRDAQLAVNTDTLDLKNFQAAVQRPSELQDKIMAAQSELREAQSAVNTDSGELQRLKVLRSGFQKDLQNNIVTAPIAGKVLDIKAKNGDGVKIGDVLLTLGDPAKELVKLQLSTLDAAKVKVNQKARIKVIGPNPQPFTGQVKSIYPQAIAPETDNKDSSSSGSGQTKVPAVIQLDQPSGILIPGSQVSVEIIQQQRQNVVVLELTAIGRSSTPFVWIRDEQGKAQKRRVTLGLEGTTNVEVKSGLRPGEQVLIPPPDTPLQQGMPVTAASSSLKSI